jgi:hypothetical protein
MTIASLISKTANVINSCETAAQLSTAEKFVALACDAIWKKSGSSITNLERHRRHGKLEVDFCTYGFG